MQALARSALDIEGIQSAAIFVRRAGTSELELGAAAGIEGPALHGLVAAVGNPAHPVARALTDPGPTFDVLPMNPGGPKLRSHLPLDGQGVLALAHDAPLSAGDRQRLTELAAAVAAALRS